MPRSNKKTSHGKATPKNGGPREKPRREATGFSEIWVAGYKSIVDEQRIEIRPLTILAGANSSGKSSIVQPLLLLKQTLEAAYDPGALLLNGPNVKFTSASQLLSKAGDRSVVDQFRVGMRIGSKSSIELLFKREKRGFSTEKMNFENQSGEILVLNPNMSHEELQAVLPLGYGLLYYSMVQQMQAYWAVIRNRCFLEPALMIGGIATQGNLDKVELSIQDEFSPGRFVDSFISKIRQFIHVPGIRGNPERTYPVTAVGNNFPGLFQNYSASMIAQWQSKKNAKKLSGLEHDLATLGLTWNVLAKALEDTEVELRVGRLGHRVSAPDDMVNVADVGLAMSQVLPVIVALHAASPGQLVFIEQPELHLHPSAQIQLAGILANAANAGVQVLVETHSSLLLLAIQTLIAEDKLSPEDVKLHWFTRDKEGATRVTSANLDERGAFGDWPEDFGTISLEAEHRYLTATEKKLQ